MNRKLYVMGIAVVFMLIAISFVSVVGSSGVKTVVGKKESPLYGIITEQAIGERLQGLKGNLKAKFVGERVFFLPFPWHKSKELPSVRGRLQLKTIGFTVCPFCSINPLATCVWTHLSCCL